MEHQPQEPTGEWQVLQRKTLGDLYTSGGPSENAHLGGGGGL